MNKKFIILFFFLILFLLYPVSAGNNTTTVDNPTSFQSNLETVKALESGDSNIQFSDGYKGYCIEWGEHSAEENETFYVDTSVDVKNKVTNEDISNNLKVMFLFFYDRTQENPIVTQHMVWKFTDNKQFSKFDQDWYNEIINLSNKYKVPDFGTYQINDTHEFVFNFKVFISRIVEYQNYFGYKFYVRNITRNESNQIINSTINNLTTNSTNNVFNNLSIQYNDTNKIKIEKRVEQSTSKCRHTTGFQFWWMVACMIIMLITIVHPYRKK